MAATSSGSDAPITSINVTPLVDVVLVLLIVLMVTAGYIVKKAIPVDLPRAGTGETTPTTLAITVDGDGGRFLDGTAVDIEELRIRIRRTRERDPSTRAVIAADGATAHRHVVGTIDILRQEGVNHFAFNVQPGDVSTNDRRR